jgi:ribonuclease D
MAQKSFIKEYMIDFQYIKNSNELGMFLNYLNRENITKLAMDFESESNLHVYGEKLCIIQIFDGKKFHIIDPFEIDNNELANLFENKKIIKYFYGCDSDLSLVYKQYNIKIKAVFDIKNIVNALEIEKKGLDAVLENILGITVNNKKYYQMYNWTNRPIKKDALEYALNDVAYLFKLYDELIKRVQKENKVQSLLDEIIRNKNDFDSKSIPTVYKSYDYKMLTKKEKEQFDILYKIRDEYARELDYPPNNVIKNEVLFDLVKRKKTYESMDFGSKVNEKVKDKIRIAIKALG